MATGRFADESEAFEAPLNAAMVEDLGLDDGKWERLDRAAAEGEASFAAGGVAGGSVHARARALIDAKSARQNAQSPTAC